MHISALILALLSATTLAAPFDLAAPARPRPAKKPSLGAYFTSWPNVSCGKDMAASFDGMITKVTPGCIKVDAQHEYIRLQLHYGVLEVFEKEGCQGKPEKTIESKKGGSERCIKKGENHWASVRLSVPPGTEWESPRST